MYTRSRLRLVIGAWLYLALAGSGAVCDFDAKESEPRSTPTGVETPAPRLGPTPFPTLEVDVTLVPAGDEHTFQSFGELETLFGYDILRAAAPFKRSFLHRNVRQDGEHWRYYEAYFRVGGADETRMIGVLQEPSDKALNQSGWEHRSVGGKNVYVRYGVERVEVRFDTGASTNTGIPVHAWVSGRGEQEVFELLGALNFDFEEE